MSVERSEAGAKANGFLKIMQKFESIFLLRTLIVIFERVEQVNAQLQSKSLWYREVRCLIDTLIASLSAQRQNGFQVLWTEVSAKVKELDVDEPVLPRPKKVPRRLDEGSVSYNFNSAEEFYRPQFFQILDQAISSLDSRFQANVINHISKLEEFALGHIDESYVSEFYTSDFDIEKLRLHRDMFLDVCKTKHHKINNLSEIISFLKKEENESLRNLLPEFIKYLQIALTIPVSSCSGERSFSALRRLKTYLRSTMTQKRINDLALLNVYKDCEINIDTIADEFIKKSEVRRNTFYFS